MFIANNIILKLRKKLNVEKRMLLVSVALLDYLILLTIILFLIHLSYSIQYRIEKPIYYTS